MLENMSVLDIFKFIIGCYYLSKGADYSCQYSIMRVHCRYKECIFISIFN